MKDSVSLVKQYYDGDPLKEWERLTFHPYEFPLTTYMMDRYIQPGDTVLDIGGGPGRYSFYYAQRGCAVTLVDLSDGNIDFARAKSNELGLPFTAYVKDCLDLASLRIGEFDHVFLMGPLYHLEEKEDRVAAVRIALDHLKRGGILYCSFILDFAGIIYDMKYGPGHIINDISGEASRKLIDSILEGTEYTGHTFTSSCFINQRQIVPFMEQFNLEKLHLFGQEGILAPNEQQIKSYPKEEYDMWIELAKKLLEIPELLAYSEHAMYIGRKQ